MSDTLNLCDDMKMLLRDHEIFENDETYGWILSWCELVKEQGKYNRINRYGIKINFCPMCGKKLQ